MHPSKELYEDYTQNILTSLFALMVLSSLANAQTVRDDPEVIPSPFHRTKLSPAINLGVESCYAKMLHV